MPGEPDLSDFHGYPHQSTAQHPDGPRQPPEHVREPVEMPAEYMAVRAMMAHIERVARYPERDPIYQEMKERLAAMEAAPTMAAQIAGMRERIEELEECLGELMDHQNGCPLPKYQNGWDAAMKRGTELLKLPCQATPTRETAEREE